MCTKENKTSVSIPMQTQNTTLISESDKIGQSFDQSEHTEIQHLLNEAIKENKQLQMDLERVQAEKVALALECSQANEKLEEANKKATKYYDMCEHLKRQREIWRTQYNQCMKLLMEKMESLGGSVKNLPNKSGDEMNQK